ncbi:MAG TPA: Vps62-related protein [Gaiellaceae bacterium]|nr:Vps62-related protein [Gaiellaceae bacterium]
MTQCHKAVLALLAALSALILGPSAAAAAPEGLVTLSYKAPSAATLLARHAPVVVLHPAERSAPTNVAGFLAGADLVGGRYDLRACSARDGLAALQCYDDADAPAPPVVYGAVFRSGGRTALQYWLFHAFDLWSPVVPQSADYWKLHEGDWEAVTVLLDARGRPAEVGASRHCGGARRAWAKVERRGARPVVYSALGSHALYFKRGRYLQEKRCWPKEALAVFAAYGVPVLDHAAAGRAVSPKVVRVTAARPAWMRFPGSFGESQYMHFPQATFAYGAGPRGPAFHDLWRRPFAAPRGWPAG